MFSETDARLGYRPAEAARALGVGRTTIYALVASGELKLIHLGPRTSIIPADNLRALIARRVAAVNDAEGA